MLRGMRQPAEGFFHLADAHDIGLRVVTPTALSGSQAESAPGVNLPSPGAARMDDRRKVLLLFESDSGDAQTLQRGSAGAVEIGGSEFDGVRGNGARVKAVEPARVGFVPV